MSGPEEIAVDDVGNVYVAAFVSSNAFKITPAGAITEIISSSGDGQGHILEHAFGIEADVFGNVFVAGVDSNNVFRIDAAGAITQILVDCNG